MSCKIPADLTNGVESNLYNKLLEIYMGDEGRAKDAYDYFRTPKFLTEIFGNYADALETKTIPHGMMDRLDPQTFEPLLMFHEATGNYYFLDKNRDRVIYPYDVQGLQGIFKNTNEIKEFAKSIAFTYYKKNLTFNVDTLEFENFTGKSLYEFIDEFVEETGENLMNSDDANDIFIGGALLDSLPFTSDWYREAVGIFNTFKLDVVSEEVEDYSDQDPDEVGNDVVRVESFLKDSKENVNNNVKLYLSLVQSDKTNMFGLNKFVEFGDIYTSLNKTLRDKISAIDEQGNPEDLFEEFAEDIERLGTIKPYFKDLHKLLLEEVGTTTIGRAQIVSAFRLSYQNYLGSETHKKKDGEVHIDVKNLSEVSSRRKTLLGIWDHNFKQTLVNEEGSFNSTVTATIGKNSRNFIAARNNITTVEQLLPHVKTLQNDLERLGVTFTSSGKLSIRDKGKDVEIQRGLLYFVDNLSLGDVTLEQKKNKIVESYFDMTRAIEDFAAGKVNNIFTYQNIFTQLAEAESFFQEEGSDASLYTVGKTKWAYSLPSYLSEKINTWKKHPGLLYDHFAMNPYNRGSYYMKYLLGLNNVDLDGVDLQSYKEEWRENFEEDAKKNLAVVELNNFNSVQVKGDAANASDTKDISYLDSVQDYMNKVLGGVKGAKTYQKTAIAADKSTEYQLHYGNPTVVDSGVTKLDSETGHYNFSTQVEDILFNYFKADYERMAEAFDEREQYTQEGNDAKLIGNYHLGAMNGLVSQIFPSMTPTFEMVNDVLTPTLPEDTDLEGLYDVTTGRAHLENLDGFKGIILDKIKTIMTNNVQAVQESLIRDGVFRKDASGNVVNVGLDTRVFEAYGGNSLSITADFLVNSIVSQVEYSKMFTGDTAYYKNMTDYKKRVPATYTDGLYLYIQDAKELYFNAAVVSSIEVPAPYINKLATLLGEDKLPLEEQSITNYYRNINVADAQAWITPQRWRFIKQKLGKWSNAKDGAIYTKMFDAEAEFTPSELKRLAQPLKGVYFDVVDGVPRYLKYSQAVLLPNLIKGTDLQKLYDKMVPKDENGKEVAYEDQIHEVITKDGMKVGYHKPVKIHEADGSMNDNPLISIPLSNYGYKLQQDLSPKGYKQTEVGSQIMKVIFQGLEFNLDKEFYIGDRTLTGQQMIDEINAIVSDLSDRGIADAMRKLGVDPDTFEITNEEALIKSMTQQLKQRADTADNTLKALMIGTSPYGIAGQAQIFQNVFSSTINKAAVKIKTNGGSFIQMADFGISKTEASSKARGIRFTPWWSDEQSKLHTPEQYIDDEGRTRVRPGGVFISGSFIAKYVPNYRQLSNKKLFGELNSKTGKYEGGLIDEKILKNIIGYRIPNQGLPSNDAFHVMGILPEDAADTIIAYTGITTKTGSDYDIDKMYIMMPSFKPQYRKDTYKDARKFIEEQGYTEEYIDDQLSESGYNVAALKAGDKVDLFIEDLLFHKWDADFNEQVKSTPYKLEYSEPKRNADKELALHEQPLDVIQNKLIEAYGAVLTSTHAIKDIMKPIDEPFVEQDIKNMYPEIVRPDMMDFDAYTDIRLKEEFKLGKAGLGQNVNALVDAVRGGMGELTFNEYFLGRGNYKERLGFEETWLDQEFSEKLTTAELQSYVDSYNEFNPKDTITVDSIKDLAEIKLADSMKALVNGFVDIAKDPFITRGNWTTQTNNIGFLLIRAGVHPFHVNAFLAQPILKEYVEFVNMNESNAIDETDNIKERFYVKKAKEAAVREFGSAQFVINGVDTNIEAVVDKVIPHKIMKKVMNSKSSKHFPAIREAAVGQILSHLDTTFELFNLGGIPTDPSEAALFQAVTDAVITGFNSVVSTPYGFNVLGTDFVKMRGQIQMANPSFQLQVLENYFKLIEPAKKLSASVRASKADTNGKGKNIGSLLVINNSIRDILRQEISNEEGALIGFATKLKGKNGRDTFLNRMIKNSILTPYKIMRANPKYFLSAQDSTAYAFNYISYRLYGERLQNQELADTLEKAHYSYIMSGFAPLQMTKEEKDNLLDNLPDKLLDLKNDPEFKDNAFVDSLYVKEGDFGSFVAMPSNKKPVSLKNSIVDGWRSLIEAKPELGEDFIKYSFLISGFNMSINQFHEFIPYEWFNKNRFNAYLKSINGLMKTGELDREFINQFHRNNFEGKSTKIAFDYNKIPGIDSSVAIAIEDSLDKPAYHFIKVKPKSEKSVEELMNESFDPFAQQAPVEEEYNYYIYVGSKQGVAYYVRTTPLGFMDSKGNKVVEYDMNYSTTDTKTTMPSIVNPLDVADQVADVIDMLNRNDVDFVPPDYLAVTEEDTKDVTSMMEQRDKGGPIINTVVVPESSNVSSEIKQVIDTNPAISAIGTPKQYAEYLKTIFPESKVDDILYHGSSQKLSEFNNKDFADKISDNPMFNEADTQATKAIADNGYYFTNKPELAKTYGANLNPVILNIENLKEVDGDGAVWNNIVDVEASEELGETFTNSTRGFEADYKRRFPDLKNKGIRFYNIFDQGSGAVFEIAADVTMVYEPSQIYILGSEKDLEGFRSYVANENNDDPFQDACPF